jgi:phosphoribosylaminoimidazole-succinocarboxamide synthase
MKLLHSGKVRDVYLDGEDLLLVASDRASVYDVVLPTEIPDKGKILTQLSLWWFEQLGDVVPHHVISSTDVPAEWAGRAIRCRRLDMLPVECIARGYLVGLGLREYEKHGAVSGVTLPPGLVEADRLLEPIFTPTTKATVGHDEFITLHDVAELVGDETTRRLRGITLEIYRRGAALALKRGVIIADTKLEFGHDSTGALVLGDELLTSDSSRFWRAEDWRPGRTQHALDKQYLRDWSATLSDWDRTPPGPPIPPEVVEATRQRYIEVFERITGLTWPSAIDFTTSTGERVR